MLRGSISGAFCDSDWGAVWLSTNSIDFSTAVRFFGRPRKLVSWPKNVNTFFLIAVFFKTLSNVGTYFGGKMIISLANQKGGVGKTTTAFNLSSALAKIGKKVLMIDNDPQCNLTRYALDIEHEISVSTDDLYVTRRKPLEPDEVLKLPANKKLDLLPSEPGLAGAEYYLVQRNDREFVLKKALSEIVGLYDFVVVDNPPALNLLTINGLVASDKVLVPVQLEFFSLEGIVLLQKTIKTLKEKNPQLELLGIVPNMFNDRRKLNWEVLAALENQFQTSVFKTKIHDSVKIAESSGHGESILDYAPHSRSTEEYLELAREIIAREDGSSKDINEI